MRFSTIICATLLFSAMAFGQAQRGYVGYSNGPYVPLITTPEISLQSASPASIGATNATHGLVAGARNSTLDTLNQDSSTSYTEPVWYSGGGAPRVSPEISLSAESVRERRAMRMMMAGRPGERRETAAREWTYFGASEMDTAIDVSAGKGARHATRTITNDDIDRANQNTGNVKYNGKTEKIQ